MLLQLHQNYHRHRDANQNPIKNWKFFFQSSLKRFINGSVFSRVRLFKLRMYKLYIITIIIFILRR